MTILESKNTRVAIKYYFKSAVRQPEANLNHP